MTEFATEPESVVSGKRIGKLFTKATSSIASMWTKDDSNNNLD